MNIFHGIPRPIVHKILLTPLIGLGCTIVGVAFIVGMNDRILFIMSLIILLGSLLKGYDFYHIGKKGNYDIVMGTCVGIEPKPFRNYQVIRVMDVDGTESKLKVGKHSKFKIGENYAVYFLKREGQVYQNQQLNNIFAMDSFLGYEKCGLPELDDMRNDVDEKNEQQSDHDHKSE